MKLHETNKNDERFIVIKMRQAKTNIVSNYKDVGTINMLIIYLGYLYLKVTKSLNVLFLYELF